MKEQEAAEYFSDSTFSIESQANSDVEVSFLRLRLPTILVVSYEIQVLVQFLWTVFELEAVKFEEWDVQNKNKRIKIIYRKQQIEYLHKISTK